MQKENKILPWVAIVALAIFIYIIDINKKSADTPIIFSPREMLDNLWHDYKNNYLEAGSGRTLDKQRDNITTSEGQSYTMLRAVWMDDKEIFDKNWDWTKKNLMREDYLFAWVYGRKPDGSYGILESQGGKNTASDADIDIALSLIFAYSRWHDKTYLEEAVNTINSIWEHEVFYISGKPYLSSSDHQPAKDEFILVNPSYLAPYAFRIFAEIDPKHDWKGLLDSSYALILRSMTANLDKAKSASLPPNWTQINVKTGKITVPSQNSELSSAFGYDAMRLPWRIALDWSWYKDNRDLLILKELKFLNDEWKSKNVLASTYSHDGRVVYSNESPAMYGASIGFFLAAGDENAKEIYNEKLLPLYNPDKRSWARPLGYYDSNWAWFGMALYNNTLPNLYDLNFD